jgi:hypothetical protein
MLNRNKKNQKMNGCCEILPTGWRSGSCVPRSAEPFTHEVEITAGSNHGATILVAARCPALPPAGQPSLSVSSDSHTSTLLGGNDVPFQFQPAATLSRSPGMCYNLRTVQSITKQVPTHDVLQPDHSTHSPNASTSTSTSAPYEHASHYCPVCSQRLESHRCKLICTVCGYYMSCADYY